MIKINLHDYRDELRKVDIQKRVVKATGVVLASVGLIALSYIVDQAQLDMLKGEVRGLESEVQALEPEVKHVRGMMARQARADTIIAGIQKLRTDQLEATRLLGDFSLRVPKDIWLTNVQQMTKEGLRKSKVPVIYFEDPGTSDDNKKGRRRGKNKDVEIPTQDFIEIRGRSFKEKEIARYIEELEKIPYFKLVFLHKTKREMMGMYPVYEFSLYCYMPKDNANAVT